MVKLLTQDEGESLLRLAREAIEQYLKTGNRVRPDISGALREKRGVFVSLHRLGDLRGCIGHPYPDLPLGEAVVDSAICAATGDPRFYPVDAGELKELKIEVTVLTPIDLVKARPKDLAKDIVVGKHGLVVKKGMRSGLLLPQVPVEQEWDVEEFLSHTCMKAGLPPDAWWDESTRIYKFEGQIFSEGEKC